MLNCRRMKIPPRLLSLEELKLSRCAPSMKEATNQLLYSCNKREVAICMGEIQKLKLCSEFRFVRKGEA